MDAAAAVDVPIVPSRAIAPTTTTCICEETDPPLLQSLLRGITIAPLAEALRRVFARDPHSSEFLEAVNEAAVGLQLVFSREPSLISVFERMCEPERTISFRIAYTADDGSTRWARGWRIQHSSALGPYKGGLRFHPTVNTSVLRMLAFEQTLKNSLTGLQLGAGKGGADVDPKELSRGELERFCTSFTIELAKYVSDDQDVPAGDIGVGEREIGYLFGAYKRITGHFRGGVLSGKGRHYGGSICRPEATGFGVAIMAREAMAAANASLQGCRCAVSGSGNVARFTALKLIRFGACVLAVSDSHGTVVEPDGLTVQLIEQLHAIKADRRGSLADYRGTPRASYHPDAKPWRLQEVGDLNAAFPCATQGEVDVDDVDALIAKGCKFIIEGANMPLTADAVAAAVHAGVCFVPGKMANCGGVSVSGLELQQNRTMVQWSGEKVYEKLETIMKRVYETAALTAQKYDVTLGDGANIAAFLKVADAMVAQGSV